MRLSIVIPTRGRGGAVERLLRALSLQEGVGFDAFEVIVAVDGGAEGEGVSGDACAGGSALGAGAPFACSVLRLPVGGVSATRNAGIERARGDVVLLLNDDVVPDVRLVSEHLAAHEAMGSDDVMVLGASPWGTYDDERVFDRLVASTSMVFGYSGMADGARYGFRQAWTLNLSLARARLSGGDGRFCELLRPVYYDDLEWAFRLLGEDGRVVYRASAVAVHEHRYTVRSYFVREALLGVMAPVLHEVNRACYGSIFPSGPEVLATSGGEAMALDARDEARALEVLVREGERSWDEVRGAGEALLASLWAAHLPLKRRAFRCGLAAAMEAAGVGWDGRIALGEGALARDAVFGDLMSVS